MEPIRVHGDPIPNCLRDVLVSDFLPEILHDLNNACAVLDGISLLLQSEARDVNKVLERARGVRQAGESLSKIGWLSNGILVALGAPVSFPDREDGLTCLADVAGSSIERRGGRLVFATPADALLFRGASEKVWFAVLVRAFAGRDASRVEVKGIDNRSSGIDGAAGIVVQATDGAPDEGFMDAIRFASSRLGARIRMTPGDPRELYVGAEPPAVRPGA